MKSIRMALLVMGLVFLAPLLRGRTALTDSTASAIGLTTADAAALKTLTPEQLHVLVNALEATPPLLSDALPGGGRWGMFYSLAHPEWPPLPGDVAKIPAWKLTSDSGSSGYLLDDVEFPRTPGGGTNGGGGVAFDDMLKFTTNSLFAVVATADNTTVTISPSATANLSNQPNPYTETLQAGQTYQNQGGDVTGTMITSDKPIAIIAGDNIADVIEGHNSYASPLIQMQLPIADWGKQALSWSFAGRAIADSYRVLAAYPNTVVFTNGVLAGTNQAGQSMDLEIYGPVEFQGTQPIQVSHMANSFTFDNRTGDPCEILLPPLGHYLKTNIINTPIDIVASTNYWPENYMTLIVPQSAITNTTVDGSVLASTNFASMGTNGYSGARISVTGGTHIVISSQPIWVEVYGFAYTDAYGYFGGVVP